MKVKGKNKLIKGREIMKKSILLTIFLISLMLLITACSSPEEPVAPAETDDTNLVGHRLSASYVDMMKNNNYMMKYKTFMDFDGREIEALITIAVSGEKHAFITESDEITSTTIMDDDKFYLIDHDSKTVMVMPFIMEDNAEDGVDITQVDSANLEFVGTGTGTFMGNTRDYEEYAADNITMVYFFDGDKLDGMVMMVEDESLTMVIEEMTSMVDESIFEIPEDYQLMDIGN